MAGSNGANGVHAVHSGPVPAGAILHAVVLLPDAEHRLAQYLSALPSHTPELTPGPWTARTSSPLHLVRSGGRRLEFPAGLRSAGSGPG